MRRLLKARPYRRKLSLYRLETECFGQTEKSLPTVSLSTLSLNHPPSLKLWRVSDLECWLYGMTELREAAACGALGARAESRAGAH